MIRLLLFLITGHIHEWETMDDRVFTLRENDDIFRGTRLRLRCKKCGDWKKKDLI